MLATLRFLGRWDDGRDQSLDFNLVDRHDNQLDFNLVDRHDNQIGKLPHGHHPDRLEELEGHRQYKVEIGLDEHHIVFKGIVEVALGYRMLAKGGDIKVGSAGVDVVFRPASPPGPSER
jgi:hypothetical protein